PISWTCPMHPDVLEAERGTCHICKMNLVAVRLDSIWTCPVHAFIAEQKGGTCPIDHRDLVRMTVAPSWTCQGRSEVDQPTKANCPDGSDMVARYTQRPHGDHNPRHGGQFFMAPGAWHHREGTLPTAGLFRMYFYKDYSKPLVPKGFSATVSVLDKSDQEVDTYELKPGRITNALEARIPGASLPISLLARVKFTLTAERGSVF